MSEGGGMADARDLKSLVPKGACEFDSHSSHFTERNRLLNLIKKQMDLSLYSGIAEYEKNFATTGTWLGFERTKEPDFKSTRKEGEYLMDNSKPIEICNQVQAGTMAARGYGKREVLYFDTTIGLEKSKVHFTRDGQIEITQGKNKIVTDTEELGKILDLSSDLKNYQAMSEAENKENSKGQLQYLKEQVKKLEAQI